MSAPPAKELDPKRSIALLAQKSQLPVDDVVRLYEQERDELATGARVTTFLHIFALRKVQEILRKRSADNKQRQ